MWPAVSAQAPCKIVHQSLCAKPMDGRSHWVLDGAAGASFCKAADTAAGGNRAAPPPSALTALTSHEGPHEGCCPRFLGRGSRPKACRLAVRLQGGLRGINWLSSKLEQMPGPADVGKKPYRGTRHQRPRKHALARSVYLFIAPAKAAEHPNTAAAVRWEAWGWGRRPAAFHPRRPPSATHPACSPACFSRSNACTHATTSHIPLPHVWP